MSIDRGFGTDRMGISASVPLGDSAFERTSLLVRRWDSEQAEWVRARFGLDPRARAVSPVHFVAAKVAPYLVTEYVGNLITRAGWAQLFLGGIIGTTPTKFSTTVGRIGVGTGTTAAAATDTALISAATSTGSNWILCAANPVVTTTATPCTVVFAATFGPNDANGAWNEFAVDQGTANSTAGSAVTASVAPMMNHSTNIAQGTKASGQTWTATATFSFT